MYMMTKEEQAKELLRKYTDGEATTEERLEVERWYGKYENNGRHIPEQRKEEIGEQIFRKLSAAMEEDGRGNTVRLMNWTRLAGIAAVLLLVSAMAIIFWPVSKQNSAERMVIISTTASETKTIVLADGSEINLKPSGKLMYPARFKADSRTVALTEGEAFFKIAHDEHRPFMVKTAAGLYTKVLGTSFNIRSYGITREICIAVSTGKVAVGNAHQVFGTLIKGQQLTYDKHDLRVVIDYTPKPVYVNIEFEGETLSKACKKLEYIYGIQINLASKTLNHLKCTATFNSRQSPDEIIDLICSLHQLKAVQSANGKTFNLYKK